MVYYEIGDERITTERLQERSARLLLRFSQSCCGYYVRSGIFPVMLFFHVHSHVLVLLSFPGFSCLCLFLYHYFLSQYEYEIVVFQAAARDLLRPEYSNGALAAVATVGFFVFDVSVERLYTETCPLLSTD